ncbi:HYR domain-containing protein [Candidatus Kaiserbacteria bacterium]|nr:HYR domain-containing protein [Candidatus Kaiserbacteria bacterium]
MNKHLSTPIARTLAALLVTVLVYSPLSPVITSADQVSERLQAAIDAHTDITPPVIASMSDISVTAASSTGIVVSYVAPATSDNIDPPGVALCSPGSDSNFPVGTTLVTCTAADAASNAAIPVTFNVIVSYIDPTPISPPDSGSATSTPPDSGASTTTPPIATSTAPTATSTPPTDPGSGSASSTPPTSGATSTPPTGGSGSTPTADPGNPNTASTASTGSGVVPTGQSDTDNTDFQNVTSGPPLPGPNDTRPVLDASATSTEALAIDPLFKVATSTDGTGAKIGGTIFTGSAVASTTVSNILNITRSSIDGPGATNSSRITADTENAGVVTTSDETIAFTGENKGEGGEGDSTVHTGSANASAQVLNVVNTNFFNSKGLVLFLKPQGSDSLDLRAADLSYLIGGGVGASPTQLGCTILTCLNSATLQILNKNEGTVNNIVEVRAATGRNSATSTRAGNIDMQTGNAYASAGVLNLVNTNFINSKYLVSSFDNFGDMQGDIVLPDANFFRSFFEKGNTLPDLNSSSYIVQNNNNETFTGTTTANAITGQNVATSTALGHGEITTGTAHTSSNSFTAANQTHVGGSSALFVFHVSGAWRGTVKGLPEGMSWRRTDYGVEVYSNGAVNSTQGSQGIYNSANFIASSTNKAIVNTDVNVWAETGANTAQVEDGAAKIKTGDAYASANVVNMVNTNVVNRNFMFAVFNIAGDWNGDIDFGGHSPDLKVTATVDAPNPTAPGTDVTYHFTVQNIGDVAANTATLQAAFNANLLVFGRSTVRFTSIPSGIQWNLGTLAPGATVTIDASARVFAPGLTSSGFVTAPLVASVGTGSDQHDQDSSNNTATINLPVGFSSPPASGSSGGGTSSSAGSGTSGGGTSPTSGGSSGSGSSGGGGPPVSSSGGGGGGSPSGSEGTGQGGGGASTNTETANTGDTGSSGSAGGGGIVAGGFSNNALGWSADPKMTVTKTSSISTSTLPTKVDYTVVVSNDSSAGALYHGVLTDTLYDPAGSVRSQHQWALDTVAPGDQITVTYTMEFSASSTPGVYHNVAEVTGTRGNPDSTSDATFLKPFDASNDVQIFAGGKVLGVSTSNTGHSSSGGCEALITSNLQMGSTNRAQVTKLQTFLNNTIGTKLPTSGFFGTLTLAAVRAFQTKYAADILKPLGLKSPTGSVYASTIKKINILACGGVPPSTQSIPPASPATSTLKTTGSAMPAAAAIPIAKPKVPAKPQTTKANAKDNKNILNAIGGWFSKSH